MNLGQAVSEIIRGALWAIGAILALKAFGGLHSIVLMLGFAL
jgi:hypothetical protein